LKSILQSDIFFDKSTINILDIGSGPATVPLALLKLRKEGLNDKRYRITTIEPNDRFGKIISSFKEVKTECIEIIENLKYKFPDTDLKIDKNFKIDWIIIANAISPIGCGKSYKDVNMILNKFISERLCNGNKDDKILLTIIEGKDEDFFRFIEYLEQIENIGFSDLKIIKTEVAIKNKWLDEDKILNCKFYKSYLNNYKPYVNSRSLLLELKK